MPDIPKAAIDAVSEAIGLDEFDARDALEAAAPILADQIASAILRHADQHEPLPGSGAYLAWHRHFDTASAVAAKAFGRDNLEAKNDSAPAGAVKEEGEPWPPT